MSKNKRLFLFAGYNKDGIVDESLIYYVQSLSEHGDVIVCMDSDCPKSETKKLQKYTINTTASHHGEYDFGSYKRAYIYARDKKILNNYDFVYLVNDSVFGPMFDIKKTLTDIESIQSDAVGLIVATHKTHSYMESWFVRLNKKIATSIWFDEFISNVKKESNKFAVTIKYEHGLSNLIAKNNCAWVGKYTHHGRYTYNQPLKLFKSGCPFIKKASFTRHNGALGRQIKYILKHSDKKASNAVLNSANNLYGTKYMNWFLTSNPIKIFVRKIKYALKKIRNGGI